MSRWIVETETGISLPVMNRDEADKLMRWLHNNFPRLGDVSMREMTPAEQKDFEGTPYVGS